MHGAAGASRPKTPWTRRGSAYVPGLALRPDDKDEHGVDTGNIPVQRHVSGCAPVDHQLAHVLATVATDQGLLSSTLKASMMPPSRAVRCPASYGSRCRRMRSKSSPTSGASSIRVTAVPPACGRRGAGRSGPPPYVQIAAHLVPGDGFSRCGDAGMASFRLGFEVGAAFGQCRVLGDRFQDESMRRHAGFLRHLGDAGLQLVRKADGGGAHELPRWITDSGPKWHCATCRHEH